MNGRELWIVGPTAVGKSAVALALAPSLDAEIVSADSMQVYQGMNIGTAKPTAAEQAAVPHHLLDVCPVGQPFDAKRFVVLAQQAVADIHRRDKTALIVGGTGLYVRALRQGMFDGPARDPALRDRLEVMTAPALFEELSRVDPATAARIDRHNPRRLVRALEVFYATGKPIGVLQTQWSRAHAPSRAPMICLNRDRAALHRRIEQRIDQQLADGWLDEVRMLMAQGIENNPTALQAAGYRELVAHLRGECSLADAVTRIKARTRQLAKRQLPWFRREPDLVWVEIHPGESPGQTAVALGEIVEEYRSRLKMHDIYEPPIERAVLVGIQMPGRDRWTVEDSLAELKDLASTAGATVVASVIQKRDAPSAPTYIGKGKAAEPNKVCQEQDANLVVFDDDLTPAQGRNLGEIVGKNINLIDRTEFILDIFAQWKKKR